MKYFYYEGKERKEYVLAENETIQEVDNFYLVSVDTGTETYHKDIRLEGEEEIIEDIEEPKEEPKKEAKKEAKKPKKEATK